MDTPNSPAPAEPGHSPTPATPIVVEAHQLSSGYGRSPVCGIVDFTLSGGGALALVGPNGAGKSTVLKTVVGQLEPVSGSARIHGQEVDDRSLAFRREVAQVFDEDAFFPSLTVAEHLAIVAAGHGATEVEELIDTECEFFGLSAERSSLPHNLSSGQRRRLLLAAAFVRPRSLLVLDEPEQRLDTAMRSRLATRLRGEVAGGLALLLVTHDPAFVRTIATSALFIGDDIRHLTPAAAAAAISETNPHAG
ncbi:ABC transporter ATP-binding protein [Arthrobacter sp. 35W]|uniref:ABC transporter ATP-binding protein n=1 Tax=Arthrobacter sp. 35W TaxID=1132441 RepID=UPI00041A67E8|nr:ABC transporter ATP-binding protein [Arthrobacter sp. 35W]